MVRKTLVLTGGGILGVTYAGAFRAMEERGVQLRDFDIVYGTSVGSLIGLLVVIGMSHTSIHQLLTTIPVSAIFQITTEGILRMVDTGGVDSGRRLRGLIRSILRRVVGKESLTFNELSSRFTTKFVVNALDILTGKHVIFGSNETPDINVEDAICASSAIPGLYWPVKIKDMVLVDGGVWNPLPIELIPIEDIPTTIALAPVSQYEPSPKPDLMFVMRSSFNILTLRGITRCLKDDRYKQNIIRLSTPTSSMGMLSPDADLRSFRETLDFIGYTEVSRSDVISRFLKALEPVPTTETVNTDTSRPDSLDQPKKVTSLQSADSSSGSELLGMTELQPSDTMTGSSHSLPPPIDTREQGGPSVTPLTYQPMV
jgi:predicted acylesterase/phospholipase RssA